MKQSSSSKLTQDSADKFSPGPAFPNNSEVTNDLNAAKVAAMKAAELGTQCLNLIQAPDDHRIHLTGFSNIFWCFFIYIFSLYFNCISSKFVEFIVSHCIFLNRF